jgi:SPP1 family holin
MATHATDKTITLPDAGTVARMAVLALALVNQILTSTGHSPLPFSDQTVTNIVTDTFTAVASIIGFWRNNNFTTAAQVAQALLKSIKQKTVLDTQGNSEPDTALEDQIDALNGEGAEETGDETGDTTEAEAPESDATADTETEATDDVQQS